LELFDQSLGQFAFDGGDVLFLNEIEVILEGLAGELLGGGENQPGQRRIAIPVGKAELAGGMNGAVDGGDQQILPYGKSLSAFGDVAIK
jgi:hypothetical protein